MRINSSLCIWAFECKVSALDMMTLIFTQSSKQQKRPSPYSTPKKVHLGFICERHSLLSCRKMALLLQISAGNWLYADPMKKFGVWYTQICALFIENIYNFCKLCCTKVLNPQNGILLRVNIMGLKWANFTLSAQEVFFV